ncbi:hypothetical protein SAMN05444392_10425 [Seinonella peptonophila]|uniref:Lipoprotein n=1 Tax=Seinonella peptonophila TaxID=112248 RepID=A0A1M4WXX6_9BACL|nr:hypothetical protein [Seinonella peptonophila]SHE86086.1 hypothetical protein SAMN05444392_10425 [Seinonella peptonophila]
MRPYVSNPIRSKLTHGTAILASVLALAGCSTGYAQSTDTPQSKVKVTSTPTTTETTPMPTPTPTEQSPEYAAYLIQCKADDTGKIAKEETIKAPSSLGSNQLSPKGKPLTNKQSFVSTWVHLIKAPDQTEAQQNLLISIICAQGKQFDNNEQFFKGDIQKENQGYKFSGYKDYKIYSSPSYTVKGNIFATKDTIYITTKNNTNLTNDQVNLLGESFIESRTR